jgi:hypothetical protein
MVAVSPLSSNKMQFAPPMQVSACESNSVLFVGPDFIALIVKHQSFLKTTALKITLSSVSPSVKLPECKSASHCEALLSLFPIVTISSLSDPQLSSNPCKLLSQMGKAIPNKTLINALPLATCKNCTSGSMVSPGRLASCHRPKQHYYVLYTIDF